jgi:hypothetical protein
MLSAVVAVYFKLSPSLNILDIVKELRIIDEIEIIYLDAISKALYV